MNPPPPLSKSRILKTAAFSLVMFLLACSTNAVMDTLSFHFGRSVFAGMKEHRQWLNPKVSWRNKWKDGEVAKGELFPLSSTSLVSLTDGWHLAKALTILFLSLALLAPFTQLISLPWTGWLLVLLGMKLFYGLVFELFFARLLLAS